MRPTNWPLAQWKRLDPLRRSEYCAQMIEKQVGFAHHSIWDRDPERAVKELREAIAMCEALIEDLEKEHS